MTVSFGWRKVPPASGPPGGEPRYRARRVLALSTASSAGPLAFRARSLRAAPTPGPAPGAEVWAEPDGSGILLRTAVGGAAPGRRLEQRWTRLARATLLEVSPGGAFLALEWELPEWRGGCGPHRLLRASDLAEVTRGTCDP